MAEEIKRVNIRMGHNLHDWFQSHSDELGVPTSALMVIALNEYRKQQIAVNGLPDLTKMINDMKQIESV